MSLKGPGRDSGGAADPRARAGLMRRRRAVIRAWSRGFAGAREPQIAPEAAAAAWRAAAEFITGRRVASEAAHGRGPRAPPTEWPGMDSGRRGTAGASTSRTAFGVE